ncbi:MAG TPA: GAF domain-containing sensor histidine kinase [Gemmatimonadaceae bacterium]|nr:GAF domain-containing sensor histidine kinase [Gemmatimonadaceae bacterium]
MTSDRPRVVPDSSESGLRELIAIREIVHAFLTADRPEEVFQFALDRVSPLVGASFACVYVVDGASELMRLAAVHNWPERFAPFLGEMRVRLGFGPSGEAAAERRVIEVPDVMADPSLEDWAEVAHELGFRAIVALPLQTGDGVLGAVAFYFEEAGAISADTRSLLRMVADQMAATAQKARLIDDLRRANAALTESNAELERQYVALLEARRVKDEFLANISHELRTPLTAVMGYLALMEEGLAGPVTEEQRRTLAQVKTSSQHLLDLIGDLLELTTLKRGGLEIKVAAFDVREPLHDALANARGRSDAVALRVREPEQAIFMVSDRRKICKMLVALLSNAYKFTTSGEIRLSVSVVDDRVVYRVEDTGIGIPEEMHQQVFDEFRQVDGSTTRRYGGSGLGLSLARRLARVLGGEIYVDSSPGHGSTFRVELPLEYREPERLSHSPLPFALG